MQEFYGFMLSIDLHLVKSHNRHMERFEDKGFDTELLSSEKVVGDASQDNLGVPSSIFHEVYLFYLNS